MTYIDLQNAIQMAESLMYDTIWTVHIDPTEVDTNVAAGRAPIVVTRTYSNGSFTIAITSTES